MGKKALLFSEMWHSQGFPTHGQTSFHRAFFPQNDDWGLPRLAWKICGQLQRLRWLSVENPSLAFNSRDWMSFCFCDLQPTVRDTLKASVQTSFSWQAKLLHPLTCMVEIFFAQMPNHQEKQITYRVKIGQKKEKNVIKNQVITKKLSEWSYKNWSKLLIKLTTDWGIANF